MRRSYSTMNGIDPEKNNTDRLQVFDEPMNQRLQQIAIRMKRVYDNIYIKNNETAWTMIFVQYKEVDDFNNTAYVELLLKILDNFKDLSPGVWEILEKNVFCNSELSDERKVLYDRFILMRDKSLMSYTAKEYVEVDEKILQRIIDGRLPSHYNPKKTKSKYNNAVGTTGRIILIAVVLYLIRVGYVFTKHFGSKPAQPSIATTEELAKMVSQSGNMSKELSNPDPKYVTAYTKETPLKVDIDGDTYEEMVYYDSMESDFVLYTYNTNSKKNEYKGLLRKAILAYPQKYQSLKYLYSSGK
jgi:hypothetical protein